MVSERFRGTLPHYAAMAVLLFVVLTALRTLFPSLASWVVVVTMVAVALAYPVAVRALGIAPEAWER